MADADYHWLVSDDASPWLQLACEAYREKPLLQATKILRKSLSAARVHLLIEQVELRQRGRQKFHQADVMFFTRRSLEQSTDELIGGYKAEKFQSASSILDLCCGIGGDSLSLASRFSTCAVDRDAVVLVFLEANAERIGVSGNLDTRCADVRSVDLAASIHIDPDRREEGRRAVDPRAFEPAQEFLDKLLQRDERTAVKLAPATPIPPHWSEQVEREWIGTRGECRQQVLWQGSQDRIGQHRATRLAGMASRNEGEPIYRVVFSLAGRPHSEIQAGQVCRFLFEPAAEILAAQLTGNLAQRHGLRQPYPSLPYLTADSDPQHAGLAAFEVLSVHPYHAKRLRRHLLQQNIGRVTVKKRGTRLEPRSVAKALANPGCEEGTVILAGHANKVTAIVARAVER